MDNNRGTNFECVYRLGDGQRKKPCIRTGVTQAQGQGTRMPRIKMRCKVRSLMQVLLSCLVRSPPLSVP